MESAAEVENQLRIIHEMDCRNLNIYSSEKIQYDLATTEFKYNASDHVLLYNPNRTQGVCPKLEGHGTGFTKW